MSADPTQKLAIVLADGHPIFRDGLRAAIEAEPDLMIAGEAADGLETLQLARALKPAVLLLDFAIPGIAALEVLEKLGGTSAEVKTVLLASRIDEGDEIQSLRRGARGIVMKSTPPHLILKSIRVVAGGAYWFGRESVSALVHAIAQSVPAPPNAAAARFQLTPRELDILSLVVKGNSNHDIARQRSIALNTVKHHVTNVFDKTGVSNRLELSLFAIHHQLIDELK